MNNQHQVTVVATALSLLLLAGCKYETYRSHAISVTNTDDRVFIKNGHATGIIRGVFLDLQDVDNVIPSLKETTAKDEAGGESPLVTLMIGELKLDFKDAPQDNHIEVLNHGRAVGTAARGDQITRIAGTISIGRPE